MRSRYTDSSLTVTLYGIDPGYVVSTQTGDWETGEPFKKRTKVDESEPEGTRYVKTAGADGRSVTVHRTSATVRATCFMKRISPPTTPPSTR